MCVHVRFLNGIMLLVKSVCNNTQWFLILILLFHIGFTEIVPKTVSYQMRKTYLVRESENGLYHELTLGGISRSNRTGLQNKKLS